MLPKTLDVPTRDGNELKILGSGSVLGSTATTIGHFCFYFLGVWLEFLETQIFVVLRLFEARGYSGSCRFLYERTVWHSVSVLRPKWALCGLWGL